MSSIKDPYCYKNSINAFLLENEADWFETMCSNFKHNVGLELKKEQEEAWIDCFRVLKDQLLYIAKDYPNFSIVFEYILPYESGRRPDVLLVSEEQVLVLEFKQKFLVYHADIDQAAAYGRDIREYHYESRKKKVTAILVLTKLDELGIEVDSDAGVIVCTKAELAAVIRENVNATNTKTDIDRWMSSKYQPLPTIVEAAKMLVNRKGLPGIPSVDRTSIPQAIKCLKEISVYAKENKKHIVAFVTGVPGAGKTFLGLQYVYDICGDYENVNSVYLSGNGPLIAVLTETLNSSVFVKDLHKIVNEYIRTGARDFHQNVIVFDEGQRAWDAQQMREKRGVSKSEPEIMIELCSKRLDWCVLLVLVGEGQEIYNGENSGIIQWNTAIDRSVDATWEIICPDKLRDVFPHRKIIDNENRNALNLAVSLRTHVAGDVSFFANALVAGEITKAKSYAEKIKKQKFKMYVTRDLERGKKFLRRRYAGEIEKRYGMIASSKGNLLRNYGMDKSFEGSLKIKDVGKWFTADRKHPKSCCALTSVATEFSCQGLEIDMPLIGWDDDMIWNGSGWKKFKVYEPDDSDANTYRKNSYRVLLTRGRDGFVIYVPDVSEMNATYNILLEAGIEKLEYNT